MARSRRPTIAMPASSAALTIASPSIISVLPASTDSTVGAGGLHRLDRRHADHRHVEPHVLVRLGDLDDRGRPARRAGRRGRSPHRCPPSPRPRRRPPTSPRWSGRCRGRRSRRRCGSRTRDRAAPRRSARAWSARPSRASSGARNAVESSSSMPLSRSTSATPAMIASVFCALSRISTPSERQVGHDVGEQLGVLDLPGHHRLGDAGVLQQADALARAGRARPSAAPPPAARAADVGELGKRLFLEGDDGDVVAGAARRVEDEEGKPAVAGDQA